MPASRPAVVGLSALLAVGAAASGASAQQAPAEITVSAAAAAGSRQFFVEDLSGATLSALDLGTTGKGQLFQVRVVDDGFLSPSAPFTASAEMTKLYKKDAAGNPDYATSVDSSKLSVSFVGAPDLAGVAFGAIPTITITGTLATCSDLPALLPTGSPLLAPEGPLTIVDPLLSPLDQLLDTLGLSDAAKPLCTALGGTSTTPLPVAQLDAVLVELQERLLEGVLGTPATLPVSLGSPEAGNFDTPSYLGKGAADPGRTATPARKRVLLRGTPNAGLDLQGLLSSVIDGQPLLAAVPGGQALTTVDAVVAALQGSANGTLGTVGAALAGLGAADQTGVLRKVGGLTATLSGQTLKSVTGTYRSFPKLQADLAGAAVGDYTGTMTVTFVQE